MHSFCGAHLIHSSWFLCGSNHRQTKPSTASVPFSWVGGPAFIRGHWLDGSTPLPSPPWAAPGPELTHALLQPPGAPLTLHPWGSKHIQEMCAPRNKSSLAGRNIGFQPHVGEAALRNENLHEIENSVLFCKGDWWSVLSRAGACCAPLLFHVSHEEPLTFVRFRLNKDWFYSYLPAVPHPFRSAPASGMHSATPGPAAAPSQPLTRDSRVYCINQGSWSWVCSVRNEHSINTA